MLEGRGRPTEDTPADEDIDMATVGPSHLNSPHVKFDPLFAHPVRVPSPQGGGEAVPEPTAKSEPAPSADKDRAGEVSNAAEASAVPAASTARAPAATSSEAADTSSASIPGLPQELQYLVDLLGSDFKDKLSLPNANGANEVSHQHAVNPLTIQTVNEDGLPIHEIRESLNGDTIGAAPESALADGVVSLDEEREKEDYWSTEAVARRQALRRRIFHEGSDTDSDDDDIAAPPEPMDIDIQSASTVAPPSPLPTPDAGSLAPEPQTPVQPLAPAPASATRSPSNPPKSILKAPVRKKSVTFDPSTRLPPDSPPARSPAGKLGFPLGDVVSESVPGPKSVPILAAPTPGRKTTPAATFGGFKRGFLTGPGSKPPPVPQPSSAVVEGPKIVEVDGDVEMEQEEKPKKQSLFAQRRAERKPAFPKLSEAKPMVAMKTEIVEKPPSSLADRVPTPVAKAVPVSDRLPTPAAHRPPSHFPPTVGTVPPTVGSSSVPAPTAPPVVVVDHEDDDSDYGDLGEFSDDEEDEYALDEALLAREVALEYHRRQGWQRPIDEDEIDPEAEAEGQDGGVLMGVPRVSTITGGDEQEPLRILNPTADDLSQFLRVGRAEDGELVFERPIVDSGSESEGEGGDGEKKEETDAQAADRRARRARRKEVMERLLRGDYEDETVVDSPERQRVAWEATLPPAVVPAPQEEPQQPHPAPPPAPQPKRIETGPVVERSTPATGATAPAPPPPAPEEPRKVSRFKAARQAQS